MRAREPRGGEDYGLSALDWTVLVAGFAGLIVLGVWMAKGQPEIPRLREVINGVSRETQEPGSGEG